MEIHSRIAERLATERSITGETIRVFLALAPRLTADYQRIRMTEIASALGISSQRVTRGVRILRQHGIIEHERPRSGRVRLASTYTENPK